MNGNLEYIKNNLKVPKGFSWDDPFNRKNYETDEIIRLQDKQGNEIIFTSTDTLVEVILIDDTGDIKFQEDFKNGKQVVSEFYRNIFPVLNESVEQKDFLYSTLSFKEFIDIKYNNLF